MRLTHTLLIVISYYFLIGCQHQKKQEVEKNETNIFCIDENVKDKISLVEIQKEKITEQLNLTGKIEYNENDLMSFKSLLNGYVKKVNFELGDKVKKGEILIEIESPDINKIFSKKEKLKEQLQYLNKQLKSKKELLADKMISANEVLKVEQNISKTQLKLEKAEYELGLYRAMGNHSFGVVSPRDGYIIRKDVNIGQAISDDSEPLFSISNLEKVWVMINVYAGNLRHIHIGDSVKVKTVASPDEVFHGQVDKIYNVFDENEHVLKARVIMENKNLQLMPGLNVDVLINKKSDADSAYAIPINSVVFSDNQEYVVLYKNDCDFTTKQITKIASNDTYCYIRKTWGEDVKLVEKNVLLLFEELRNR